MNINPTGHQSQVIQGSLHLTVTRYQQHGVEQREIKKIESSSLLVSGEYCSQPPGCVYNYKPAPSARAFKISKWASFTERLRVCCLCIGPWGLATASLCEPFKTYLLVLHSLWVLWMQTLLAFKARCLGGHLSYESLTDCGQMWSLNPSLLREKLRVVSFLPIVCFPPQEWDLWQVCFSVSPTPVTRQKGFICLHASRPNKTQTGVCRKGSK